MIEEGCRECEDKRGRINYLEDEIHSLEQRVRNLENTVEMKDIEVDAVTTNLAEVSAYVQDLEQALAEACLMSREEPAKT